jgi:hypothetical protein
MMYHDRHGVNTTEPWMTTSMWHHGDSIVLTLTERGKVFDHFVSRWCEGWIPGSEVGCMLWSFREVD